MIIGRGRILILGQYRSIMRKTTIEFIELSSTLCFPKLDIHSGWWFGCHFCIFPIYWESHHPNWLSYFSEGWLNHQPALHVLEKMSEKPSPVIAIFPGGTVTPMAGKHGIDLTWPRSRPRGLNSWEDTRWCPRSLAKLAYKSYNYGLWDFYLYLLFFF